MMSVHVFQSPQGYLVVAAVRHSVALVSMGLAVWHFVAKRGPVSDIYEDVPASFALAVAFGLASIGRRGDRDSKSRQSLHKLISLQDSASTSGWWSTPSTGSSGTRKKCSFPFRRVFRRRTSILGSMTILFASCKLITAIFFIK